MNFTRECTEVYYATPDYEEMLAFTKKRVQTVDHFDQRVFKSQDRFESEKVKDALTALLYPPSDNKDVHNRPIFQPADLTWKEMISRKRQFIKKIIHNQAHSNIAQVARFTNSSREMVRQVYREMDYIGEVFD